MRQTISGTILRALAEQDRRVLSPWRALLLVRRATLALPEASRRWTAPPRSEVDLYPVLRQMERRGEIEPLPDAPRLYRVTVPYATASPVDEYETLFETHPYATLSHLSALSFHHLTYQLPKRLAVVIPSDGRGDFLPLDTDPSDWEGLDLVRGRTPERLMGVPVRWTHVAVDRLFGIQVYRPRGYAIRAATPERTLLDGLLAPELCGGIENVLVAWGNARDTIDLDAVIHLADRLDVAVLRQRVGYVLDQLRLAHPRLEEWQRLARRGGSSKLLASEPYAATYDERWSLSLNAPTDVLRQGAA